MEHEYRPTNNGEPENEVQREARSLPWKYLFFACLALLIATYLMRWPISISMMKLPPSVIGINISSSYSSPLASEPASTSASSNSDCMDLLRSLDSIGPLPHAYPPVYAAHQAVLKILNQTERWSNITKVEKDVDSVIETLGRQFVNFVANSTSPINSVTLGNDCCTLDRYLRMTSDQVQAAIEFYTRLKGTYFALIASAAPEPVGFKKILVLLDSQLWLFNTTKRYLVPYENSLWNRRTARAGLEACELESSRLEHILQLVQGLSRSLQDFWPDTSVCPTDESTVGVIYVDSTDYDEIELLKPQVTREWVRNRLKEQFQQISRGKNTVKESWTKLVESREDWEEKFRLRFDQEWCNGKATPKS